MKRLILVAFAAMTLFAGDTLAQTRPDASPTAPQAAATQPTPAAEVTDTMVANCLNETLALSENAAFAASPRTQPVDASLKLAPCAGGETVRLRTVMRVDNVTVHDSAWRQVADALETRAAVAARPKVEPRQAVRTAAPAAKRSAPAPAQTGTVEVTRIAVIFLMAVSLLVGLLIGCTVTGLVMANKRRKRREPDHIGPRGEVSPTQPAAVDEHPGPFGDGDGVVTRN